MRKDYSTSRTLGIVGLGIMGGAKAEALRAAGYPVYGYDPVTAAMQRFKLKERTWTIFASGDKRAFARARLVLGVFADSIPYLGAFGNGMRMKMVANHLVAILNVASAVRC